MENFPIIEDLYSRFDAIVREGPSCGLKMDGTPGWWSVGRCWAPRYVFDMTVICKTFNCVFLYKIGT